jgi:hypothetical protein
MSTTEIHNWGKDIYSNPAVVVQPSRLRRSHLPHDQPIVRQHPGRPPRHAPGRRQPILARGPQRHGPYSERTARRRDLRRLPRQRPQGDRSLPCPGLSRLYRRRHGTRRRGGKARGLRPVSQLEQELRAIVDCPIGDHRRRGRRLPADRPEVGRRRLAARRPPVFGKNPQESWAARIPPQPDTNPERREPEPGPSSNNPSQWQKLVIHPLGQADDNP